MKLPAIGSPIEVRQTDCDCADCKSVCGTVLPVALVVEWGVFVTTAEDEGVWVTAWRLLPPAEEAAWRLQAAP